MKLISPREAARRLKVHASTVSRVIDRNEVRQETIRVDRHRVQGDEKSEDLLFTSPAFKEKVQAAGGRLVLCEVGPFLNKVVETAQPAGLLCIRGGEQEALQALTRSAGGGQASLSHAQFAGANGGMAMGAEDPEERTEAPPAKAQAAGTVFWLVLLAVQLPTAATPWLAAGLPKLPDPFRGYALALVRGCPPS